MSLNKSIVAGKEKRKPYRSDYKATKGKNCDPTCRNHGTCAWCEGNRTFKGRKAYETTEGQIDEFFCYWFYPDPTDVLMDLTDEQEKAWGIDYEADDILEQLNECWGTYDN